MNKRMKRIRGMILIVIVLSIGGIIVLFSPKTSAKSSIAISNTPAYKLQENILQTFRPEWEWDEEAQEYTNLGDLVRDPETGLFPEPSPFPEDLKGIANWDPYLGLYIKNTIDINHETGEMTFHSFEGMISTREDWPVYDVYSPSKFNTAYLKYHKYAADKYYEGGMISIIAYPDMDIFEWEAFTPEWFGLSFNDLPMILDTLEVGAPPSYTMSLIMLLTKTDVEIRPTKGSSEKELAEWVTAFNALTSGAQEQVKQGNLEGLGYFALPYICDELLNGNDSLLSALPEQADGLEGADKADTAGWSKQDWLDWFENNAETMEVLEYVCQREISMPWLE